MIYLTKRKTHIDWAYEHTNAFKIKKDELSQMNIYEGIREYIKECGPNEYSVGHWTILKHISLAYCINPFGVILKSKSIRETVFLDLFCGAGITPLKSSGSSKGEWIVGSPIISTRMTDYPFRNYYFCDTNRRAIELLKKMLDEWNEKSGDHREYTVFEEDANVAIKKLAPKIKHSYVFAFIDPSGFQWEWESMKTVFCFDMFDILMNFQTRQVDRIPREKEKVFFGPCAKEINNLADCDQKLIAYIKQIENMGLTVTPIRIGMSRTNQYYYHLLHISRLNTYRSIPLNLKDRVERFNGESIKTIWNDLHRHSRQTSLRINEI